MLKIICRYSFVFILAISLLFPCYINAQNKITLNYTSNDSSGNIIKKYHPGKQYNTKEEAVLVVKQLIILLYKDGYLASRIDSVISDSVKVSAYISVGKKYLHVGLRKGNLDKYLINQLNFKEKTFSGKPFKYDNLVKMSEKLLVYCENNGYPFAEFRFDSITVSDEKIDAAIDFQRNNKIVIDSIIVKGTSKAAKGFLYSYLSIKPGNLYNESLIRKVDQKLRELTFISEIKPMEVMFTEKNAKLFLYVDKKKASSFYGVIGVLPNNQSSGKLLINGELKLTLLNSFGRGELIDLNWRSISKSTQDLKLSLAYPFLFSTPFGITYKFILYKQDTSYLTLNHDIGIQYYFSGNNYLKIFADIYKSDLLSTSGLEAITVLPDYADVSANLFGLEFLKETYDYRINPRKGHLIHFSAAAGMKKIRKNSSINNALYDSIKLNSTQFRFMINGKLFIPLFRKMTILLSTQNAYILNNTIFENELYRLGGLNSLRGFDEESIKASYYNLLLFEYRYLFERNSFFGVFANVAYYEKRTPNVFVHDVPYGFGAGVSFDTKIGIFSIYYALGSQFGQAITFRQSKIHFGFTNNF